MPLNPWSDEIMIAELFDEPMFSEDTQLLNQRLDDAGTDAPNVIVCLGEVGSVNSSNLGALLRLRKTLNEADRRLLICSIQDPVWTIMLATGLDQVFSFTEDVTTALAKLQLGE